MHSLLGMCYSEFFENFHLFFILHNFQHALFSFLHKLLPKLSLEFFHICFAWVGNIDNLSICLQIFSTFAPPPAKSISSNTDDIKIFLIGSLLCTAILYKERSWANNADFVFGTIFSQVYVVCGNMRLTAAG